MGKREPSLIKINTAKQADFVRYLFARVEVKEKNKEIKSLKKAINIKDTTIKRLKVDLEVLIAIVNDGFPEVAKVQLYKRQLKNTINNSTEKGKKIERLKEELFALRMEYVKLKDKLK